jgi:BirA family biotin operon repressor/biotin-[acetyl-CoA-carboxylase] ligase
MQPAEPSPSSQPASTADPIDWSRLGPACSLMTIEHLAEAESTMHRGRDLAAIAGDAALPAVVLVDRQTQGHGRRGAGWWQAAGSLAMTLVVDPAWLGWSTGSRGSPAAAGWSLACGVAIAESIRELEPSLAVGVRWPNDVEMGGRKLAGILAEASAPSRSVSSRVLFGIGVNTAGHGRDAPPLVRERLVTIPDLLGRPLPRQRLLETFLPTLWQLLSRLGDEPQLLAERYRPLCTLTGRSVTLHQGADTVQGECLGIDADGAILIRTGGGVVRRHAGSLTPPGREWRRPATEEDDRPAS